MIGIIGAMDEEVNAILKKLKNESIHTFYNVKFWAGTINDIDCVIAQSGIGKVNAGRCTQLLIEKFQPSNIINIGSSGALNPRLNIGDVVISTSCVYHDVDITAFGYQRGFIPGMEDRFLKADKDMIELCKEVMNSILNDKYSIFLGPIATGDIFCNSAEIKSRIFEEFGADCVDMEGAAIAHLCQLNNVPFIAIRSISDKTSEESAMDFKEFLVLASERCAEFIDRYTKALIKE